MTSEIVQEYIILWQVVDDIQLISKQSHTARRSFATNAYAAGVPLQSIMTVTGHSREERLKTYLRLQDQEKGIIAANAFAKIIEIKREA